MEHIEIVIIILNMCLSYITFKIGDAKFSKSVRGELPYDIFHSIVPDFSKSKILDVCLVVTSILPILFQYIEIIPSELFIEYTKSGIFVLILGNIFAMMTMYNPLKNVECVENSPWYEKFIWHCYRSFFNDIFANACIFSLLLYKYNFSSVASISFSIIIFILSLMKRVPTIDLIMSGIIGIGLVFVNKNQIA
jgi:hypothetical protein